jgi:Xaa-Pro aminopeptidase
MKSGIDVDLKTFLSEKLKTKKIGIDGFLFSVELYKELSKVSNIEILPENLIDEIWEDQPSFPKNPVFHLDVKYSGIESKIKINDIREQLKKKSCGHLLLSALDEIAWTLNLRGSDISYNPVFLSYLIVSQEKIILFCDKEVSLDLEGFELKPYSDVLKVLETIEDKVWIDDGSSNISLFKAVKSPHVEKSPISMSKGIKNEVELQGMRNCQVRDGVAMAKFLCWIEEELNNGNEDLTEVSVADQLEFFRKQQKDFVSLSFSTISGFGSNGAIIHYSPEKETCAKISKKEMFLLDSGAQYLDGTTDTTRTMHFGTPTDYERECFTNVLKGHIELDSLIFPKGTTGQRLDLVARMHLWKNGQDFRHGVGHGVGHFLNVHEGPHGIGSRVNSSVPFVPNMVVTNGN